MLIKRHFSKVFLFLWLLLPNGVMSEPFSDIYFFGDSLTDVGNVLILTTALGQPPTPGVPYFQGRFSNGPNYADVLASNLGLGPLTPSLLGGHNYAVGGARASSHLLDAFLPPGTPSLGVQGQVQRFLSDVTGNVDTNALYVVWGGSNDVEGALTAVDPLTFTQIAAQDLFTAISALASAGAEHILVPAVPDFGLTPRARNLGAAGPATNLSQLLNATLDVALRSLAGIDIIRFDTFALLQDVVDTPEDFRFTNVVDLCYEGPFTGGPPAPCADPAEYLFWDDFHPTAAGHQVLGTRITAAVVPEPSTWLLFVTGFIGLFGYDWRTRGWRQKK